MKYYLLDHLAQLSHVHYVSDLKDKDIARLYKKYILSIDNEKYTLADWKDVCDYLLGNSSDISSIEDAKKGLEEWLNAD